MQINLARLVRKSLMMNDDDIVHLERKHKYIDSFCHHGIFKFIHVAYLPTSEIYLRNRLRIKKKLATDAFRSSINFLASYYFFQI